MSKIDYKAEYKILFDEWKKMHKLSLRLINLGNYILIEPKKLKTI